MVDMFRVEQNRTEKKLAEIISGKCITKLTEKECRIFVMVNNYNINNIDDFFNGMISNLEAD